MVWLVAFMDERGRPPSVRELGAGLGMRSTRSVADHLIRLAALDAIERIPGVTRGISVVDPDLWRTTPRSRYAPTEPARYTGAVDKRCSDDAETADRVPELRY